MQGKGWSSEKRHRGFGSVLLTASGLLLALPLVGAAGLQIPSAVPASFSLSPSVAVIAANRLTAPAVPEMGPLALTSPDAQAYGYFGGRIAVSGDLAVVGAFGENVDGHPSAGRAYVFNATTGALVSTVTSPNEQTQGAFGDSVAISGSVVVVGAPFENGNCGLNCVSVGRAYTFNATSGKLISTLTIPQPQAFAYFGWSVAISGNTAVVGAYGQAVGGEDFAGQAYTFNARTGALTHVLTSPNAQLGGEFGWSVAASGKTVLIGAPDESVDGFQYAGHAYTFSPAAISATGKVVEVVRTLASPNAAEYGAFGQSVAISGKIGVVVAYGEGLEGRTYTFNPGTRALIATISGPSDARGFGWSVALSGNVVIVGAPFSTAAHVVQAGHAYKFNATTGKLIGTFSSPNPQAYGIFGISVGVSGNITAVGADNETADGYTGSGVAYLF